VDRAFLAELQPGDHVVHVDHGVGRFSGVVSRDYGTGQRDYVLLEYQGEDRLYVPTDQLDRVTRYIGAGEGQPALNRLGTTEWARAKARARGAAHDIAEELIKLYAVRASRQGHAFSPDNEWQVQMEAAFPYVETPDQLQAIQEVKADMETPHIMDRLVCGDVGYGKTEVALRAAFKAAMDGRQVGVLVPTTVLAEQHYLTFTRRLAPFPVKIELLSRFRSTSEQKQVVAALADGSVDIVIGTHRLLQKDVKFRQLGLVVIDEEQRFGVSHKERLKQLRQEVDVLTLSATPIPRTLHMSLAGVRDMSVIDTPPEERLPVKTFIAQEDDRLIRNAVLREFERDGQVYFVHNRVQTIGAVAERLRQLLPEARIAIGHGQMAPEQLERVMLEFSDGKANLLLCTTIIESGLDIPNANTIIIHRATHLGLAQLYQLRGRVGRSNRRAYAYLLYGNQEQLPELAERRLRAVFEASELGAGFKIAMKDLEIRGAGNLLGADQHGHVGAVGFDLYTRLLAEEIDTLRGQVAATPPQVTVDLPIGAMLPDVYIGDQSVKIDLYRRLAAIGTVDDARAISQEISDRFGPPPEPVENLLTIIELKGQAISLGVSSITVVDNELIVKLPAKRQLARSALYRAYGSALRLTPNQLRLPIAKLGPDWPGKVKDLLAMLG
jgi:transcription-repair coupling factor (superfamily II helicase)